MNKPSSLITILGAAAVSVAIMSAVAFAGGSNQGGSPAQAAPVAPAAKAIVPAAGTPQCTADADCATGETCDTSTGACVAAPTATQPGSVVLGDQCEESADCQPGTFCGKSSICVASKEVDAMEVAKQKAQAVADKKSDADAKAASNKKAVEDATAAVKTAKDALASDVADCAGDTSKCDPAHRAALTMSLKDAESILATAKSAAQPAAVACNPAKSAVCAFQVQARKDGQYHGALDGKVGKGTCETAEQYNGVAQEVTDACADYTSTHSATPAALSAGHTTPTAAAPHVAADPPASTTSTAIPAAWAGIIEAQRRQGQAIDGLVHQVGRINGRIENLETWQHDLEAERHAAEPRS